MELTLVLSSALPRRFQSVPGLLTIVAALLAATLSLLSGSPARAESQDFDINEIVLPTDLVASVVKIEDDILISNLLLANGGSEGGEAYANSAAVAMQPQPKTGNVFESVDAAATVPADTSTAATASNETISSSVDSVRNIEDVDVEVTASAGVAQTAPAAEPETSEISVASLAKADVVIPGPEETIDPTVVDSGQPTLATIAPVTSQQEVEINEDEIILGWATAWSNNNVEDYLGYYADEFVPANGVSRDEWEARRRKRLQNQEIRIIVSNAELFGVEGDTAEVRFTQRYTSKSYKDRVIKSITMRKFPDGWKFLSEKTLEELPFK